MTHQAPASPAPEAAPAPETIGMARAASLIAAGNVVSRVLGLARETVIANLFGATGQVSAFRVAQIIPTMLYDLLVGGMVSSALVPVFSEQAERDRCELWHLASLILSLTVVVLGVVVLLIEVAAPQLAFLMAGGFAPELLETTTRLMRLTTPAVLFLSLSGIVTGLLYALKRFALDRNLASRTGEQSIAWMQYATTIIQFPLGLISAAISLAILPTLSRLASAHQEERSTQPEFMDTLAVGLRLVLILIIPATAALFILADPIVALLFQHGDFTAFDTQQTTLALRFYLLGLTFAAIDQPLIFAFYARQNTLTPALVGLLGVGFYLAAALLPALIRPMQMTDLVLANSVQLTGHALVMLWLVNRIAPLGGRGLGPTTFKAVAASASMGLVLWISLGMLKNWLPIEGFVAKVMIVGILGLLGGGVYLLVLYLLRVPELSLLLGLVKRVLGRFGR